MTVLAMDFGGRRIKLGLVSDGRIVARTMLPALADRPLIERLDAAAAALKHLGQEHHVSVRDCVGVGLGFPSIIDAGEARILDHFGKFDDARSLDLRAWARDRFDRPLTVENDARLALVGEWRHGAGRGAHDLVMITLGTGLGVAVVMEGRLLRGAHGQAGILGGHFTARYGGRPCVCGNRGCSEAEASTWSLDALAREWPGFAASALAREPELDYAALFRLAASGDACARGLVGHSLEVWSAMVVSLIHAYDPETVILGGGVMGSGALILPAVRSYVGRHAHTPWGKVRVEASRLGDTAALLGCEWLVNENAGETGAP